MTSRERVLRAVNFQSVDKPALECNVNAVALYEHGEKIRELFRSIEGDFGPITNEKFDMPSPEDYDSQGRYWKTREDEWGVTWGYRIFGIQGHPLKRPLDDWENLPQYKLPPIRLFKAGDEEFERQRREIDQLKEQNFFVKRGWITLMERSYALRRFEDVLADIACKDKNFLKLTDLLMDRCRIEVENLLKLDVDGVQIGDDFGMQKTMLISPDMFRSIYKPRFAELIAPIKKAGKKVFLHSCGNILPILEDLKEIGVDTLWPQVSAYDIKELAAAGRDLRIAMAIHPERAELMTNGSPDDVKRRMHEYAEIFRPSEGGSWFYLEIDNGFPYATIEAMAEVIHVMRK